MWGYQSPKTEQEYIFPLVAAFSKKRLMSASIRMASFRERPFWVDHKILNTDRITPILRLLLFFSVS